LVKTPYLTGRYLNHKLSGQLITYAAEESETDEASFLKSEIADIYIEYYYAHNYIQVFFITQLPYIWLAAVYWTICYFGPTLERVIHSTVILIVEIIFEMT
jgi:hypothetical protein